MTVDQAISSDLDLLPALASMLDSETWHGCWRNLAVKLGATPSVCNYCAQPPSFNPTGKVIRYLATAKPQMAVKELVEELKGMGREDVIQILRKTCIQGKSFHANIPVTSLYYYDNCLGHYFEEFSRTIRNTGNIDNSYGHHSRAWIVASRDLGFHDGCSVANRLQWALLFSLKMRFYQMVQTFLTTFPDQDYDPQLLNSRGYKLSGDFDYCFRDVDPTIRHVLIRHCGSFISYIQNISARHISQQVILSLTCWSQSRTRGEKYRRTWIHIPLE